MAISLSAAKWLAPLAFAIDFAAQIYGMLSKPNMKDVHDANISFFSPQPYFIAGLFFPLQIFQLAWLWRLHRVDAQAAATDEDVKTMVDFAPFSAVGNLCLAIWMLFWNNSYLKTANVFVVVNSAAQLYYISSRLPRMNSKSLNSVLTHVVAKMFAGLGVLDFLHNGSVAYFVGQPPSIAVKILTGFGFGLLSASSDWIFGGSLVYDLIALAAGQTVYGNTDWGRLLGIYAGGAAVIVGVKNILRPPYNSARVAGYDAL